jgi:ribonucleotide reductase beta subunit family protein with ferritin-like domain
VQDCYHDKYGRVFKPTEIKMMLTAFSNMETVHIAAYSHLLDTIGMPESEYGMFLQYKEMKDKHDYLAPSASTPTRTSPRRWPCSAASPRGCSCSPASPC